MGVLQGRAGRRHGRCCCRRSRVGGRGRGEHVVDDPLHAEHSEHEQREAEPLVDRKALAEKRHAEDGGEEDLGLVRDLRDRRLQVGRAHEEHHVLQRVQQRRHRELHPLDGVFSQVGLQCNDHRTQPPALVGIEQRAYAELDELLYHHRCEIRVGRAVQQLGVSHEQHRSGVLHCKDDKGAPLLPARVVRHGAQRSRRWLLPSQRRSLLRRRGRGTGAVGRGLRVEALPLRLCPSCTGKGVIRGRVAGVPPGSKHAFWIQANRGAYTRLRASSMHVPQYKYGHALDVHI